MTPADPPTLAGDPLPDAPLAMPLQVLERDGPPPAARLRAALTALLSGARRAAGQ